MTPAADQRAPILFLLRSPAYVRNFDSVLRALAARGFSLTVVFEERKEGGGGEAGLSLVDRLSDEYAGLRHEPQPALPLGVRGAVRMALRAGQDYLRYFEPPFREASRLRSRALAFLPERAERGLAGALRRSPRTRSALASAARRLDARLGDARAILAELERRRPAALLVSPMVQFRSRQSDWVRAARGLGIPTMLLAYSWDNLTTKGLMHAHPDRIAVWNGAQRRQAIDLHGAGPDSIVATGAWPYDHWFGWRTSRSREQLCEELGLPGGRAMILYACSSRFIAEREREALGRWLRALRASEDARIAAANVIVRPHPLNASEWCTPALDDMDGVAVFPPGGADPVDDASRADYFDSIAHADAVVGVNTSTLIESAIIDRPALAFPAAEFRSSQDDLPHFRELVGEGGPLATSVSMPEHLAQLRAALADPTAGEPARRRFVEGFIRPPGPGPSPTERVVEAVSELLDEARGAPLAPPGAPLGCECGRDDLHQTPRTAARRDQGSARRAR